MHLTHMCSKAHLSVLGVAQPRFTGTIFWIVPAHGTSVYGLISAYPAPSLLCTGSSLAFTPPLPLCGCYVCTEAASWCPCRFVWISISCIFSGSSTTSSRTIEVTLATAIRLDRNLEHLTVEIKCEFTDEAGVALAEALTVNKTLRMIALSEATLGGTQAYEAFSAMLRVNTSLVFRIPRRFKTASADKRARLVDSHNQMRIEQRLNHVGRGRLLSSHQTVREEWVYALHRSNSSNTNSSFAIQVICLYSLLRLNPAVMFAS
jgi:hypothetical protein